MSANKIVLRFFAIMMGVFFLLVLGFYLSQPKTPLPKPDPAKELPKMQARSPLRVNSRNPDVAASMPHDIYIEVDDPWKPVIVKVNGGWVVVFELPKPKPVKPVKKGKR